MIGYHALAGLFRGLQHFQARVVPKPQITLSDFVPAEWHEEVTAYLASYRLQQVEDWLGSQEQSLGKQLLSVFSHLGTDSAGVEDRYLPLQPLDLAREVIFPQEAQTAADVQAAYHDLWDQLLADVRALESTSDIQTYITSLESVVQRYLWCVPAFEDDISLYEYSRVLSALLASSAHLDESELDGSQAVMRLLEGDISGIQRFIYTIKAKGASKGLRARSFYLQALTQVTARLILRDAGMPSTNLLYAGGGRFFLILPPNSDDVLAQARRELDEMLLTHHDGDLYLALGWADIRASDLAPDRFGGKWRDVSQAVSRDKRRRFGHLSPQQMMEIVFTPRGFTEDDERSKRYLERTELDVDEDDDEITSAFSKSLHDLALV